MAGHYDVDQVNEIVREEVAEALAEARRWIPVEERLPEDGVPVVVWYELSGIALGRCCLGDPVFWETKEPLTRHPAGLGRVTHWQPLPPPPEEP